MFSWTQARIVLPAWYGLGTALEAAREQHGLELLREMERDWPFFAALLSNAEMACVEGRPATSPAATPTLCGTTSPRASASGGRIEDEFRRTHARARLRSRGEERLLDREPVLRRSIERRNPYVDPLSFIQIELLRRAARRRRRRPGRLARASLLAINGIAGGLRNTG